MTKPLPSYLTSYDFLKFAALLLMVVDHIGYYFYPDDFWWRVVGRMSAPIWLFLIGYARSRDFSAPMWIGIAILEISNFAVGQPVLPLSILVTILACRALIDPLMARIAARPEALYPVMFIFFLLTLPVAAVLEYGAEVMGFVMLGYMVRNRESLPFDKLQVQQFALVAAMSHVFYQVFVFFAFDLEQKIVAGAGIAAIVFVFLGFRPYDYPGLTARLPAPLVWLIKVGGRRSLEFYVLHLVLFRFAVLLIGNPEYQLFDFRLFQ
jgi:hypothetical protein